MRATAKVSPAVGNGRGGHHPWCGVELAPMQHAFMQLIHQERIVPADFIAFAQPTFSFRDIAHRQYVCQSQAMAFGRPIA